MRNAIHRATSLAATTIFLALACLPLSSTPALALPKSVEFDAQVTILGNTCQWAYLVRIVRDKAYLSLKSARCGKSSGVSSPDSGAELKVNGVTNETIECHHAKGATHMVCSNGARPQSSTNLPDFDTTTVSSTTLNVSDTKLDYTAKVSSASHIAGKTNRFSSTDGFIVLINGQTCSVAAMTRDGRNIMKSPGSCRVSR